MKLNKILSVLLFLLCSMAVNAQYPLQYCAESATMGSGQDYSTKTYELGAAIKLDAEKLTPFIGGEISSIKLATIAGPKEGEIKTAKDLKVFIRKSLTGENLYVQNAASFTIENLGEWFEVKLDQPFPIDGQEIYVGYSLTANSIPLGFDGSKKPDSRATWVGVDNVWESFAGSGNACIQAMVSSDRLYPRKVLMEHFTTAACINCPEVHQMLESFIGNNVVWVAHHSGYMEDSYTTPIDKQYLAFFAGAGYAPAIMYDRVNLAAYGAVGGGSQPESTAGPVFFPGTKDLAEGLLSVRTALASIASIDMDGNFNPDSRKLTVKVYGTAISELLGSNTCINVFLTESEIKGKQTGATGTYIHNRVFRDAITGAWGDKVTIEEDGSYSKTYEYTLKESWVPENMNVVAFISNVVSSNVNNCEVYNANSIKLIAGDFTNIDTKSENKVSLYSDGSMIGIEGEYSSVFIYDYTGKLVKILDASQNTAQVVNGCYIVKVITGEQTVTEKVIVK